MAEEREDAGLWKRGSIPFRLIRSVQRTAVERAEGIVVLTHAVASLLFGPERPAHVRVIPCCVDVEAFERGHAARTQVRDRLGLDERPVLAYVGKFGGWYRQGEMAEFFARARVQLPGLHFLILSQSDHALIQVELDRFGIRENERTILRGEPSEIAEYLSAADAAIAFISPSFSKVASSPTKIGEYLAAGLPVVTGRNVGDIEQLIEGGQVGVVLDGFGPGSLESGAIELAELMADENLSPRAVRVAREELSLSGVGVPAYESLYSALAQSSHRPARSPAG